METVTIHNHPATTPVLVSGHFYSENWTRIHSFKVYAFPDADEGFSVYSADTGAYLCWCAQLDDVYLDAALALKDQPGF